jgi:hypothetical protein
MFKKLLLVGPLVLLLSVVNNTRAQEPASLDVGNPALAGSVTTDGVTWTIQGAGADVWGSWDQFHYVCRPLAGDGSGSVHLVSMDLPNEWAKVGVMIRETLDGGSKHVMIAWTRDHGLQTAWREETGGGSQSAETASAGMIYVKIERVGDTINTYFSPTGDPLWIPHLSLTVPMNTNAYIGMFVCSHQGDALGTATFDNVDLVAPVYNLAWAMTPLDGSLLRLPAEPTLSWMASDTADSHNVYFGATSPPPLVSEKQAGTSYPAGLLAGGTTYYWQIGEVEADDTEHLSDVLSLRTYREGTGSITREVWEGIGGGTIVSDLTGNANYPANPSWSDEITSFNVDDFADNFGSRIHGWLVPETSGDYTFWVASDDASDLYLSTSESPCDAVRIAYVAGWTCNRCWDSVDTQNSTNVVGETIPLEAGQKYYIAALYKEGGGGDNCSVAWEGPDSPARGVIDGYYLSPFENLWAWGPSPADGATGVGMSPTLSWQPAVDAVAYEVTFDGVSLGSTTGTSVPVGPLVLEQTYEWRVDAIVPGGARTGCLWSFTVANNRVIDDFDAYDITPRDVPPQELVAEGCIVPALWGYYPLNGDTLDASGNGNDGTAVGGTYVDGKDGQAMLFSAAGGDDYVDLGTGNPSARTGQLSVSLWLNWNGLSTEWQGVIGKRDNWAGNDMMWHLEVDLNSGELGANREGGQYIGGYGVPVEGEWEHCAFSTNGTTGTLYRDGAQVGSGAFTYGTDPESEVVFGCDNAGGWNGFNGALDEVRIYSKVLSADEVAELAALGDPVVDPVDVPDLYGPMRLHLEFEGDLTDSSGNGHDGTAYGDISFETDPVMGQVLSLPGGDDQYVGIPPIGLSGNDPTTIACWAKADHTSIPDWTLIFGFTGTATGEGGDGSHFNIGSIGGPGGIGAHVWGWERTILSDEEGLEWHHYAMTYDGTAIAYYGDAVLKGKENFDLSIRGDRVHVGSRVTQASSFPGKVDDARVYDYALSPAEVASLAGIVPENVINDVWSDWGLIDVYGGTGTMVVDTFSLPGWPLYMGEVSRVVPFADLNAGGGKALSVWFSGDPANVAQYLYMVLSDGDGNSELVVYDGDSADLASAEWREWNIDMRDFEGVDMGNAERIAIGLAGLNGSTEGDLVDFDDLRVYTSRCMPWLKKPAADINNDCVVNIDDVMEMIDDWGPAAPKCTVTGDGEDIWASADAFHYMYREVTGDAEIIARVAEIGPGSNAWAKAGVMMRETLDADSKHMIMALTGGEGGGIAFQGRPDTAGSSYSFHGDITASPPQWVRLTREGNTFTAYYCANGVDWELITDTTPDGAMSNPIDVAMAETINVGLFITSHAAGELRTAEFDHVSINAVADPELTGADVGATSGGSSECALVIPASDLNEDGTVDWKDLFILLDGWLDEQLWPY